MSPALLLAIALCSGASVPAQEELPAARAVIDRYIEAVGGKAALSKQTSRRASGQITMPGQGVTGTVEVLAARPDLMRLRMTIPGVGEIHSGYDGRIGWSVNPLTGPMLMEGKALAQMRADADFDAALHAPDQFASLQTVERTTFEGRPAYRIRAVRRTGDEDFEFFDTETGLMLGAVVTRESPMGPVKATHLALDYKAFDGVRMPTRIVQRLMGTEQVITIDSVEFNTVDKTAFVPPESIRTLIR